MALSKRFLGLGFTFSATDKGLEKKLKAVQSSLEGIDTALKSISGNASSASSGLGSIKFKSPRAEPQFKQGPDLKEKLSAKPKSPFGQEEPSKKMRVDELGKTSKRLEKLFLLWGKKIFKNNSDMFKAFYENVRDLRVELNENGDIATKDLKKLRRIAQVLEKIRKVDESLLFRTRLKLFFTEDIPKYLDSVKSALSGLQSSIDRFFTSIGFDFRAIIPEQIRALAGIAKSLADVVNKAVLKPLLGFGKKLFEMTGIPSMLKSLFSKESEKQRLQEELKELRETIGGNGQKTTNTLLYKILKQLAVEKKEGMSLLTKALLTAAAFISGVVLSLANKVKQFFSVSKGLGFLSRSLRRAGDFFRRMKLKYVADAFEYLAKKVDSLKSAYIGLKMNLVNLIDSLSGIKDAIKSRFLKLIEPIKAVFDSFKSSVMKYVESFKSSKIGSMLFKAFSGLVDLVKVWGPRIGESIFKILANNPWIAKVFSFSSKVLGRFVAAPLMLLDVFFGFKQAFEEESNAFIAILKGLVYTIDNLLLNIPSFLIDKTKSLFGFSAPEVKTPENYKVPIVPTPLIKNQDLGEINLSSAKQTELLQKQVQEQQRNNALILQMIDAISATKDGSQNNRAANKSSFLNLGVAAGAESPV